MGTSFLITLREGLEASLIVAILLTYLTKTNRQSDARHVWSGTFAAIAVCLVGGTAIYLAVNGLNGKARRTRSIHDCSGASGTRSGSKKYL
ncbi:MAG: FTR1 family protein [Actinomycetota bacterium]